MGTIDITKLWDSEKTVRQRPTNVRSNVQEKTRENTNRSRTDAQGETHIPKTRERERKVRI